MEYEEIDLRALVEAYDDYFDFISLEAVYSELHDAYVDYLLDISELYGGNDIDYQEFYDGFLGGYL